MKAIVYGEIIWDVYTEEQLIGGAPFNYSAHLAHLGNDVFLISAVGNDDLGKRAIESAEHYRIKTSMIQKNSYNTGACVVTLNGSGVPEYNVLRNTAYDHISVNNDLINSIKTENADLFYYNTLIQRESESKKTLRKIVENCDFKEIFCDINVRKDCFDKDSLLFCMNNSTTVKISDEESHFLYDMNLLKKTNEDFIHDVAKSFPNLRRVIYTLGKEGSCVLDVKSDIVYNSGEPDKVSVVSTVGAGDCFSACFSSVLFNGGNIPDAIAFATEKSGVVVSHRAAIPF